MAAVRVPLSAALSTVLALLACCTCGAAGRKGPGPHAPPKAPPSVKGHYAGTNLFQPVSVEWSPMAERMRPAVKTDADLRRMAYVNRKLSAGASFTDMGIGKAGDPVRDQWEKLKTHMRQLFKADDVAVFWNVGTGQWNTCGMFAWSGNSAGPTTFCGSNKALGLPIPCRTAEQGKDFRDEGSQVGDTNYEPPSDANTGDLSCGDPQRGGDTERLALSGTAARQFGDFFVVIYMPTNQCSANMYRYPCYSACCNSYYSTSPFCANNGYVCY